MSKKEHFEWEWIQREKEEERKKVQDLTNSLNQEIDRINKIDYVNKDIPSKPEYKAPILTKKEYDNTQDQELEDRANKEVDAIYSNKINNIQQDTTRRQQNYNDQKKDLESDMQATINELAKDYANAKQSASDNALKRGLGRSSIILEQLNELNKAEIDSQNKSKQNYNEQIKEINNQINNLELDKQKAIDNLDVNKAYEYAELIAKFKDKRDEYNSKVTEYNNQISQQNLDNQIATDKAKEDIYSKRLSNSRNENSINKSSEYKYKQGKIYNALYNHLMQMPADDALEYLINNNSVVDYIGNYLYNKLFANIRNHK